MMIVIIHELNHYLRRVKRKDVKIEDCSTGKTQSVEEGELMFNTVPIGSKIMRVDRETSEEELTQWQALVTTANSKNISFATPE